jgi:plastocyanin
MSRRLAAVLAAPLPVLLSAGCTTAAAAPAAVVEIQDLRFTPQAVTVAPGSTVEWRFDDGGLYHHVHADDGSFDSDVVGEGTYSVTFDEVGTHPYVCSIHPYMTGTVTVSG